VYWEILDIFCKNQTRYISPSLSEMQTVLLTLAVHAALQVLLLYMHRPL